MKFAEMPTSEECGGETPPPRDVSILRRVFYLEIFIFFFEIFRRGSPKRLWGPNLSALLVIPTASIALINLRYCISNFYNDYVSK